MPEHLFYPAEALKHRHAITPRLVFIPSNTEAGDGTILHLEKTLFKDTYHLGGKDGREITQVEALKHLRFIEVRVILFHFKRMLRDLRSARRARNHLLHRD